MYRFHRPSILIRRFLLKLGEEIKKSRSMRDVEMASYLSVMDGIFVPSLFHSGMPVISSVRKKCSLFFIDVHLMI